MTYEWGAMILQLVESLWRLMRSPIREELVRRTLREEEEVKEAVGKMKKETSGG